MTEDVSQTNEAKENESKAEASVEKTPEIPKKEGEATGLIDKASIQADRLEAANKKHEELIEREEEITAKRMLAGRGVAGEPSKTPEQSEQENLDAEINKAVTRFD